jgi:polysaccharide biosynthesis/export protein
MKMEDQDGVSHETVPVVDGGKVVTDKVTIVPITAELIIQRERSNRPITNLRRPTPANTNYLIGPYDVLEITVWDHPEITNPAGSEALTADLAEHVVQENGTIFFPYVGVTKVAGRSLSEVRKMLAAGLSKYIEDAQLDVRVIAYRSQRVYVVGEVKTPGIQPVTDVPLTVAEAINRSGGVTPEADLRNITLSRGDQVYPIDLLALYEAGDAAQNVLLSKGDVLNVPDSKLNKVFVLGEVTTQSSQLINKGRRTLAEALGDAGGVSLSTSNPEQIYVIRGGQPKPEIFHLNGSSPDALILADRFSLQARDVVYVETAGVTRFSRVINQILIGRIL